MAQRTSQTAPSLRERARALVDVTEQAAAAYGRPDLVERLATTRSHLAAPDVRVLVVGEYKQGKSSLVNALLNLNACPVDDDIATSVPTAVRYAKEPSAVALRDPSDAGDAAERETIPLDRVAAYASEAGNPQNERGLTGIEIGVPRDLLSTGMILVDTPGVGGLASAHSAATLAALPTAMALVFVTDAARELTAVELDFLRTARATCPNVVCVLTKVDLYPEWRRIHGLDAGHLRDAGIDAPLLPVSTALRFLSLRTKRAELDKESGYPGLLAFLEQNVIRGADILASRLAAHDQLSVVGQLESTFRSEREALAHPENGAALVAALDEAKGRAARLRSESAGWQQTLNDGVTDLTSEADFDLRARFRRLTQEADDAVELTDPGRTWEQFQEWFQQRVAAEIAENYLMMVEGARRLAERVTEHFASSSGEIELDLDAAVPTETLRSIELVGSIDPVKTKVTGTALTLLRGSYSGTTLLGMIRGMAGFAAVAPLTAAVGLVMGGRALKEERHKQLAARRQQAKTAHRRYADEVSFRVGKHSRDTLRRLQRELRDRFTGLAEELQRSTADALAAAQTALQMDQTERAGRLLDVDAELARLGALRLQIAALAPDLAAAR